MLALTAMESGNTEAAKPEQLGYNCHLVLCAVSTTTSPMVFSILFASKQWPFARHLKEECRPVPPLLNISAG